MWEKSKNPDPPKFPSKIFISSFPLEDRAQDGERPRKTCRLKLQMITLSLECVGAAYRIEDPQLWYGVTQSRVLT
jgi:hypothetical protein